MKSRRALTVKCRYWTVAVAAAVTMIACTACGASSSGSASSTAGAPVSTAGASQCVTEAKAAVSQAEKPQPVNYPGAIDIKALSGKTVWIVPDTLSNPLDVQVVTGFKAAAKAAGVTVKVYDGQGTVRGYNTALDQAVGAHPAGIVIHSIDASHVPTELAKAKAAGIPVVSDGEPDSPAVEGYVNQDFPTAGKEAADFALAQTNCHLNGVVITANIFGDQIENTTAIEQEIRRLCPQCKLKVVNIDVTTIATSLGVETRSLLTADPDLNYMLVGVDPFAQFVVPAISQAHSSVKVVSSTGNPVNLQYIKNGHVQT